MTKYVVKTLDVFGEETERKIFTDKQEAIKYRQKLRDDGLAIESYIVKDIKPKEEVSGVNLFIGGLLSSIVSLGLLPPVFGLISIMLGVVLCTRSSPKNDNLLMGLIVIILGISCAILGAFIGYVMMASKFS
ncbi:MAG: hypothetical protein LBT10_08305 [Methanobrevibacter sp.]|jgi:hypothetical protein|nr:hypothetical protein [Methanobrevibacter sp.]